MVDIEEIRLNDDEIVQAMFNSKGELYQMISSGHLKKSIRRYNGKEELDGDASFFDCLEFSIFICLENFFTRKIAEELAEEWADMIGKNALDLNV